MNRCSVDFRKCVSFGNKNIISFDPYAVGKLIKNIETNEFYILQLNRVTSITEVQADNIIKYNFNNWILWCSVITITNNKMDGVNGWTKQIKKECRKQGVRYRLYHDKHAKKTVISSACCEYNHRSHIKCVFMTKRAAMLTSHRRCRECQLGMFPSSGLMIINGNRAKTVYRDN